MKSSPEIGITYSPPHSEWRAVADLNRRERVDAFHERYTTDALRQSVIKRAAEYSQQVLGESGDVLRATPKIFALTGHQPVLYHSGITRKNHALDTLLADHSIQGLEVIIDTDWGDAVELCFPSRVGEDILAVSRITLTTSGGSYHAQRFKSEAELESLLEVVRSSLYPAFAERWHKVASAIMREAGSLLPVAASRIRRSLQSSRPQFPVIPLSLVLKEASVSAFLNEIIDQGPRFATAYNHALDSYRAQHGIKNHAQPLPNLRNLDGRVELPVWAISPSGEAREPLWRDEQGQVWIKTSEWVAVKEGRWGIPDGSGWTLAPRAVAITAILRLLLSDLFIHGRGGGRYDQILNDVIENFWGLKPPQFVVASETRVIDPERLADLEAIEMSRASGREMQYRLERYLGQGLFPSVIEQALHVLHEQRQQLRGERTDAQSEGRSLADLTHRLKDVDKQIQARIAEYIAGLPAVNPSTLGALRCREYPSFFWETSQ
jgi:hypothetical protein